MPYQGSKKKINKKIVEIIKQNFGTDKPIYDIFGGGGAITAECIINGLEVHYNDLDEAITNIFQKVVSENRDYLKTLIISRDEFFEIRDKENKTTDDELKLLVNSFGNTKQAYLYSKEFSDLKHNLAVEIIKKHDTFYGYRKTDTYIKSKNIFKERLQQLGQLEQLQRLQQLERLQSIGKLEQLQITNHHYEEFSDVNGCILYLDPPYEGTNVKGYKINSSDSMAFYDWAFQMAKNNIVLVSSYKISDSRFECAYEFKTARSTLCARGYGKQTEKLFMVK